MSISVPTVILLAQKVATTAGVIELDVRNEAMMLNFGWVGVLLKPFDFGGQLFEEMVPVVDKGGDHPPPDIGLFVCVRGNTDHRHGIDG